MAWFVITVVVSFIVAGIASSKGRSGFGWFLYSLLLMPIAFIHVLFASRSARAVAEEDHKVAWAAGRRPCPYCAEMIKRAAVVCPHCRSNLEEGWAEPLLLGPSSQISISEPPPKTVAQEFNLPPISPPVDETKKAAALMVGLAMIAMVLYAVGVGPAAFSAMVGVKKENPLLTESTLSTVPDWHPAKAGSGRP